MNLSSLFIRKKKNLRVLALLSCRNEELYLRKCLLYLFDQGIEVAVIDNGSTDRSREIIESFISAGKPVTCYDHPFSGTFDWVGLLRKMEGIVRERRYDWYILTAPDEILEPPEGYSGLLQAIGEVDKKGFNTVNFDEFVFIPTSKEESFIGKDYEAEMQYYYFFEPRPHRLVRAWKRTKDPVDLVKFGSHKALLKAQNLFPENFILKHYIFLSHSHGVNKYSSRVFAKEEIQKGWHKNRLNLNEETIVLPGKSKMKRLEQAKKFDRSDPLKVHLFIR